MSYAQIRQRKQCDWSTSAVIHKFREHQVSSVGRPVELVAVLPKSSGSCVQVALSASQSGNGVEVPFGPGVRVPDERDLFAIGRPSWTTVILVVGQLHRL